MRAWKFAAIGLLGLTIAGCSSDGGLGPKTTTGAATGAVAGGIIGAVASRNVGGAAVGALIGGLVGGTIGATLDDDDRRRAAAAEAQALEYGGPGAPVSWRGANGNYGTIVAGPVYPMGPSPQCREYTHTIYIGGQPQTGRGTACRNPDGSWTPVAG
ncbi:MAG TPA: glycine zipper domain-containing protein [Xanthobacteraceae bacterium]|nr:glycine zipper domain-containing protein [Xanthobacteraceae bacterium]